MLSKEHDRIQWLDVLRGVAILLVLLFHFSTRYGEKYPLQSFSDPLTIKIGFGWIGVHLFFMISGFIIYLTIQKKRNATDFLVARLARLLPPYWAAILFILLLEYLHEALFHTQNRNDWLVTLFNIAMVPDLIHVRFLDGAFWSLFVEVKFYVLFALLWQLLDMKNNQIYYLSYGVLLALAGVHNFIHHLPFGENFDYFLIFWTGIAACKVLYEKMPIWVYILITAFTTISTLGIYAKGPELILGIPVFSALFILSATAFNKYPKTAKFFQPLSWLGRVSYSCYLIHQPVGYLALGAAAGLAVNQCVGIIFAFSMCYGIAWLGFKYVEQLNKPIGAFIMNMIELRRSRAGSCP